MTDSELRELMRVSAEKGRRALFDEYCAYVYAIAAMKLKNCASREDIEECVSDVFAEIYRAGIESMPRRRTRNTTSTRSPGTV